MSDARMKFRGFIEESRFLKSDWLTGSNGRVLAIDRQKMHSRKSSGEGLMSALLSEDKDLASILQEVDDITKKFQSIAPDTQGLSKALHRSVMCAIKRSLLDREFRSLALMDDLTRLYNRRAFYTLAAQQLKVMRRKAQGLLLFFADVRSSQKYQRHIRAQRGRPGPGPHRGRSGTDISQLGYPGSTGR